MRLLFAALCAVLIAGQAFSQSLTPGSAPHPPLPYATNRDPGLVYCDGVTISCGAHGLISSLGGGGNVNGPVSSTSGFVPQWNNTAGTLLGQGLPVGGTGNNTIVETDSGGHINNNIVSGLPNSQLATMAGDTTKCNPSGSGAVPTDCSTTTMQTLLGYVTGPGSSTNNFIPQWSGTGGSVLAGGLPVGNSGNSTVLETSAGGTIPAAVVAPSAVTAVVAASFGAL
jgi:hypothetical protein